MISRRRRVRACDSNLPIRVEPQLECNPTADLLRWLLRWNHGCDGDGGLWFRLRYHEWKGALDRLRGALLRVVDDDGLGHCANRQVKACSYASRGIDEAKVLMARGGGC